MIPIQIIKVEADERKDSYSVTLWDGTILEGYGAINAIKIRKTFVDKLRIKYKYEAYIEAGIVKKIKAQKKLDELEGKKRK